jgi:hypothetical protein
MENNPKWHTSFSIYVSITRSAILFFFNLSKVLLLRLGLFFIVGIPDFFRRKKFPILLLKYGFLTGGISLDPKKIISFKIGIKK